MKEPLRIYVAGPYTPYGCMPHKAIQVAQQNVDRAIEAGNHIHDIGHYAFVPHLSHYLHIHHSCKVDRGDWYYHHDNTFLDLWANAFLYLGPSFGTDKELHRFAKRNVERTIDGMEEMPIFYNIGQIPIFDPKLDAKSRKETPEYVL